MTIQGAYPLDWPFGWERTARSYRKWSLPGGRAAVSRSIGGD